MTKQSRKPFGIADGILEIHMVDGSVRPEKYDLPQDAISRAGDVSVWRNAREVRFFWQGELAGSMACDGAK